MKDYEGTEDMKEWRIINELRHMYIRSLNLRFYLFGTVAVVGLFLGSFGALETSENEAAIINQTERYEKLHGKHQSLASLVARNEAAISYLTTQSDHRGDVSSATSLLSIKEGDPDEVKVRSFCVCVPSVNTSKDDLKICHSKSSVCDDVSKEICEAQHLDHQCG